MQDPREYFQRLEEVKEPLLTYIEEHYLDTEWQKLQPREKSIEQHVFGRSRFFLNSVLPWIGQFGDTSKLSFIEIGPGTGSITAPLAMHAKHVDAYDISLKSAQVAVRRCDLLGLGNVTVTIEPPEQLLTTIAERHSTDPVDAVIIFAVLEHMKIDERIASLRTAWSALKDGGLLVIGDTPNRLIYRHGHTSRFPFFDMVPDEIMLQYSDKFPNAALAAAVKTWTSQGREPADVGNMLDRWGRGVSFHEFELALGGDLNKKVVADGLERSMARAIPITRNEIHLMRYLNDELCDIPLGFGRAALYLILRKNAQNARNERRWDEDLVRGILKA